MDFLIQVGAQMYAFVEASKYVLLWLGCYFEGTLAMVTGGILIRLHQADFWTVYPVLVTSDFLADVTWYGIGYFGARRFVERWGQVVGVSMAVVERIERLFHKYHTSILIVSKLTMGFGLAVGTLFTAGLMRVPFMRFCIINFLGSLVWVLFLIAVGYYFGNVLALIPPRWQVASTVAALAAGFFFVRYLTTRIANTDW